LDELSSGTRLQVLLAVRIAFVEQQEQGVKLPLLLDETLANSDDLRAKVIIESMTELARSGRQVFYFTAQGDEVAKWLDTLGDIDDIDHNVIDLADVRDLDRTIHIPDLNEITAVSPDPPSPDDHDHGSYGTALDVPPFNPHHGAGTAHLWYLIDDVAVLHQFLELGIDCWGQLQNLLERGNGDLIIEDSDCLDEIQHNAAALEAFVQAWKVGRGEPVDRQALEASGAVSNNFINEVTELATEVNGSAEQLIDALRDGKVNQWRSNKTDELETYFRDNGYFESRDTLDVDQIRLRVVEQFIENGIQEDEAHEKTTALLTRITTPSEQEPTSASK
jgi:energy-coupling factor transporter ATP-binding protein EcfA2